jgi:hypothetical protein
MPTAFAILSSLSDAALRGYKRICRAHLKNALAVPLDQPHPAAAAAVALELIASWIIAVSADRRKRSTS